MNQFGTQDNYLKVCDMISQNGYDARLYHTSQLATYDITQSLIHFMPHKNKVAVIHRGTPLVEIVTSLALKNQNQIIFKKENENTILFLETLDSNTHFVFWTDHHEITGEYYYNEEQCEEIHTILNRKKIFSIQVSQKNKNYILSEPCPYTVLIQSPDFFQKDELTAIFFSEKQKIPFGIAGLQKKILQQQITVSNSEKKVIVFINEVGALSVKQYLKLTDQDAFIVNEYPSWTIEKWISWWSELQNEKYLKSLLVLSEKYVQKNPNYIEDIKIAEAQIKKISSWQF